MRGNDNFLKFSSKTQTDSASGLSGTAPKMDWADFQAKRYNKKYAGGKTVTSQMPFFIK